MKLLSAAIGGVLVAGIAFAIASTALDVDRSPPSREGASTDNAYVQGDITPISPRVSGYISEVNIVDNQRVLKGHVLFRIEDGDYLARLEQAKAGLASRKAALGILSEQMERQRALIYEAMAVLRGAEADAHRAMLELQRVRTLSPHGAASQEAKEQAEADEAKSRARLAEAKASLDATKRQIEVLHSQRPQLEAEVSAAAAIVRLAEIDLENTGVRAPADGRVAERQARVGQYVRPGTLLVAVVGQDAWVTANFKETQIHRMRIGSRAQVSVDGIPNVEFRGRVESFSPASGARFALLPPDNATGNFTRILQRIPVKIVLESGQPGIQELRPGMSARVKTIAGSGDEQANSVHPNDRESQAGAREYSEPELICSGDGGSVLNAL